MEAGFVAGWPEEWVRLQLAALRQEGLQGELPASAQERQSRQALPAQGVAQPALPLVFSGNRRRMWLAKRRAIACADKAACGKESLNQEVPVAEVNASPW